MASFLKRVVSRGGDDDSDERPSRSRSRGRSLSPFHRSSSKNASTSSLSKSRGRSPSAEGLRRDDVGMAEEHSGDESEGPVVCPSNAFESEDEDDSEEEYDSEEEREVAALWGEGDEELVKNTEANSSLKTPQDFIEKEGLDMVYPGEGPNLLTTPSLGFTSTLPPVTPTTAPSVTSTNGSTLGRKKSTKARLEPLEIHAGRPVFEKNRCTVVLTQGNPDAPSAVSENGGSSNGSRRRRRRYLVASDLSEESLYAIEWAIGTVLRSGDECLLVSVMETDSKFDPDEGEKVSSSDKKQKQVNQRERQANALMLSRQATALLERTRLNVTIICQAIHAKVPRHMLIDMIDYHAPTLVIVGSRGLAKIKGMLLGSVSNYLIQKSSVPVMVTRRPLRVSHTVHRKLSSLNREARTTLSGATIEKESKGGAVEDDPDEPEDVHEQIEQMSISEKK